MGNITVEEYNKALSVIEEYKRQAEQEIVCHLNKADMENIEERLGVIGTLIYNIDDDRIIERWGDKAENALIMLRALLSARTIKKIK